MYIHKFIYIYIYIYICMYIYVQIYILLWGHILPYLKDGLVQLKHILRASSLGKDNFSFLRDI